MRIKNLMLLGILLLCGSCNNEGKTSGEVKGELADSSITSKSINDSLPSGCYSQIEGRDTSQLQIDNKNMDINGTLSYNIFQKDRNDGTLQAEVTGDILSGWYLFKSEGVISVRQVAWKIKANELWPGTGEMVEKNDTMFFSAPDKLQYDGSRPFKKVECII